MNENAITITPTELGSYISEKMGPFLKDTVNCLKGFKYKGRVERSPNGKYHIPFEGRNNYIGLDVRTLSQEYLDALDERINKREEVTLYCLPRFQSTYCGGFFSLLVYEPEYYDVDSLCDLSTAIETLNKSKIYRSPFPRLDKLKKVSIIYTTEERVLQDFLRYTACFVERADSIQNKDDGFKFELQKLIIHENAKAKDIVELVNQADGDVIVLIRGGGHPDSINIPYAPIVASALLAKKGKYRLVGIGHSDNIGIGDLVIENFAITPTAAGVIIRDEITAQLDVLKREERILQENHEKLLLHKQLDALKSKMEAARGNWEEERQCATHELASLRQALSTAEEKKEKLVQHMRDLNEEKEFLQRDNKALQDRLEAARETFKVERSARKKENDQSASDISTMRDLLSTVKKEKEQLEKEIHSLRSEKDVLQQKMAQVRGSMPAHPKPDGTDVFRQNIILKIYVCFLSVCLLALLYYLL